MLVAITTIPFFSLSPFFFFLSLVVFALVIVLAVMMALWEKRDQKKENGRGSVEEKKDESKSSLSLSGSVCHQSYFPPFIQFALSSSAVSILDSSAFSACAKLDKVFTMRAKILHVLRFLAHPELGILASLCMHSEIVVVVCLPCLPGKKSRALQTI